VGCAQTDGMYRQAPSTIGNEVSTLFKAEN